MKRQKNGFQGERQVVLPPMVIEQMVTDSLTSSLYVTDIGYYPTAAHHYRERREPIAQYVLIYCVTGSGWYRVGGKDYQVRRGQFFVLPPGIPHSYGAVEGASWTIYWLHFSGTHAPVYADGMLKPHDIHVAVNSRIMDRISIFEEMLSTLSGRCTLEELRYVSSLLHHFLASMRYLTLFRQSAREVAKSVKADDCGQQLLEAVVHFMEENVEGHITLHDVALYTGYSPSHLSALFKKHTGRSPLDYFNCLKIENACRLLTGTDLKINQICHKVGIDDPYYFSRLFKRVTGQSPKAYRTCWRQGKPLSISHKKTLLCPKTSQGS